MDDKLHNILTQSRFEPAGRNYSAYNTLYSLDHIKYNPDYEAKDFTTIQYQINNVGTAIGFLQKDSKYIIRTLHSQYIVNDLFYGRDNIQIMSICDILVINMTRLEFIEKGKQWCNACHLPIHNDHITCAELKTRQFSVGFRCSINAGRFHQLIKHKYLLLRDIFIYDLAKIILQLMLDWKFY